MNSTTLPALPLVGRSAELAMLHQLLDDAQAQRGRTLILTGDTGIGKSRLARVAAEEASRRNWSVAFGRGYAVESGVPYAPLADAFLPLLQGFGPEALAVLTRGAEAELVSLFPILRPADAGAPLPTDPAEYKSRVLWTFSQLLGRLAAKQPLLLVLEDLQWADASSLELLHFVARQLGSERLAILSTYNLAQRELNPRLRQTEQSLTSLGVATVHEMEPLSAAQTDQLVQQAFEADAATVRDFTDLLYRWTQGNPFFIEQTLRSLVVSGHLRQRDGRWTGWELQEITLPRSIRDVVIERTDRLSPDARELADLHAAIGTRATYETLRAVSSLPEPGFLEALEELRRSHIVLEHVVGESLVYDFSHPVLRETLYAELGHARARLLHGIIGQALERLHGESARHVDELAFHFARAGADRLARKATTYLTAAGRNALGRFAYREAADYLSAALEIAEREAGCDAEADLPLISDLARTRQRLGEFEAATRLWERARAEAECREDMEAVAAFERKLGLAAQWSGHPEKAIEHHDRGLAVAGRTGKPALRAKLKLSKGECLRELGRPADAAAEFREALALAEQDGDLALRSRVHRALLLMHSWTGPLHDAREHGMRALELSELTGDRLLACTTHWALAVLAGLRGNLDSMRAHIQASERLADEARSPLHRLWLAEVNVEYLSATGEWDAALAVGERAIAQAHTFRQKVLLPRLLVWTSLIHLARGDLTRAESYLDEAWELSGAGESEPLDVHSVVVAHTGRAAYHLARGEYESAVRTGNAGLAIADRSGYVVWAIHRLLPIICEACVLMRDLEGAARIGERLRRDSESMEHRAGLAWAEACDAILVHLTGDLDRCIALLGAAADRLEAMHLVWDAARLRRQYAARLRDHGEPEEALVQLRRVHAVFTRLGAESELRATREQIRELGARPPAREGAVQGAAGLTAREVEIVRLVAGRRSNKAIASQLDISARTVSTHLSHIFRKLNVGSRGELAEVARTLPLQD